MTKAWDIVAYTYNADTYCPDCIVGQVLARNPDIHSTRLDYINTERDLWRLANLLRINRDNEASFDSGDFPKVVFSSQVEDVEHCGSCGRVIDE